MVLFKYNPGLFLSHQWTKYLFLVTNGKLFLSFCLLISCWRKCINIIQCFRQQYQGGSFTQKRKTSFWDTSAEGNATKKRELKLKQAAPTIKKMIPMLENYFPPCCPPPCLSSISTPVWRHQFGFFCCKSGQLVTWQLTHWVQQNEAPTSPMVLRIFNFSNKNIQQVSF